MFPSATRVKQSYSTEQIIFITLRHGKSTLRPKPFTILINKSYTDKFEGKLEIFRPKAKVAEK